MSGSERDKIVAQFEHLMEASITLKALMESSEDLPEFRLGQFETIRCIGQFVTDLFGDSIRLRQLPGMADSEHIEIVIRVWHEAFGIKDSEQRLWEDFFDEMRGLQYGDEPEILRPLTRKRGEHSRPRALAWARLSALQWANFLRSRGVRPAVFQRQIEEAYGTRWDAIRKWKRLIEGFFEPQAIEDLIDLAGSDNLADDFGFPEYTESLRYAGNVYRSLIGLPIR